MTELEKCEIAKLKGYTYCPISGNLYGIRGKLIKNKTTCGYINVSVIVGKKKSILGHRLAWYLYYGKLPKNFIDHIDGVRDNNVILNLRDVTRLQNNWNTHKSKGYRWSKKSKKFQSRIKVNKKSIHIGYFKTEQEARNAYLEAKKKYHVIPS